MPTHDTCYATGHAHMKKRPYRMTPPHRRLYPMVCVVGLGLCSVVVYTILLQSRLLHSSEPMDARLETKRREPSQALYVEHLPPTTVADHTHAWSWHHFEPAPVHSSLNTFTASRLSGFCTQPKGNTTILSLVEPTPEYVRHVLDKASADAHWVRTSKHPQVWINTHAPEISIQSGALNAFGVWDVFVHDTMMRSLEQIPAEQRTRYLVVDVGANIGYFSLLAASLGFDTLSFEPMLFNAARFGSAVKRNGLEGKIILYNNAVGSTHRAVIMRPTHQKNQGNFAIQRDELARVEGVYGHDYVWTVLLDDIVARDVLFMKIDVETFENHVLDGARALICKHVVKNVITEYDPIHHNVHKECSTWGMLTWMRDAGYEVSDALPNAPPLDIAKWHISNGPGKFPPNLHFRQVYPAKMSKACSQGVGV